MNVGIDAVDIIRFIHWSSFSKKKLSRIFSNEEQTYILSVPEKTAERFAARFAAKEAFYKAVSALLPAPQPFLHIAKLCTIESLPTGRPVMHINWEALSLSPMPVQVSLTHTKTTAFAVVIIESN